MFASLLLLPSWIKVAIGAVLVVGALQVQYWWKMRDLKRENETLTTALDREKTASAELRVGLSELKQNSDMLADKFAKQSAAIDEIQRRATQVQQRARADALAAIRAAERRADDLRNASTTTVAPGHVEMNAWFSERFGQ